MSNPQVHIIVWVQGSHYKAGESRVMQLEMLLMYVEVIYLWRALPFCGREVKQQLLDKLNAALPAEAQPVHRAMRAWLRGGILNSLNRPIDAEKVRFGCGGRGCEIVGG